MHSFPLVADLAQSAQQEFDRPTVWQRRGVLSPAAANDKAAQVRSERSASVRASWIRSARGLELCFMPAALATLGRE